MVSIGKQPSNNFETLRFFRAGLFAVRKKPHSYDTELQKKNSICTLSDIFCEPPLEGWSWSWLWSDLQADLGVEVSVSPVEGEVLVLCTEHSRARHYCCGSNCSPTAKYWEIFLTLRVKREKEKAGEEEQSFFIQNISEYFNTENLYKIIFPTLLSLSYQCSCSQYTVSSLHKPK